MADAPIRCLLDVMRIPWQAYRLPTDGRKARARCKQRCELVRQLASFARPDGSNIWPSVETLATRTGECERTVHYLMEELVELGFVTNGKQRGRNGPRFRALNVAAILKAGETLQDSQETRQDTEYKPCNLAQETLQDSTETLQLSTGNPATCAVNPAIAKLQPNALENAILPPSRTFPPKSDGWDAFRKAVQPCTVLAQAPMTKKQETELRALVNLHGWRDTAEAAIGWAGKREFKGMTASPWHFFLKECEPFLREARYHSPEAEQVRVDEAAALDSKLAREALAKAEAEQESADDIAAKLKKLAG